MSIAVGAGLLALAAKRRGRQPSAWTGSSSAWTGAGLVARGAFGYCPVNHAIGRERRRDDPSVALSGSHGIRVAADVTVRAPAEALYEFWRDLSNLPRVMPYLDSVTDLDGQRSHWVVKGPGGTRLEWDAEIINERTGELLAWRSLPGADVASAGSVRFRRRRHGVTDVSVRLQYDPPAGKLGASLAWMLGHSPQARIVEALQEFKDAFEADSMGEIDEAEDGTYAVRPVSTAYAGGAGAARSRTP